jgi:hypothetical protein
MKADWKRENRPSKLWPIGSKITFADAWGHNLVDGRVIAHYPDPNNILVEDTRGVRHFGQTWRVTSGVPSHDMFDDLLGDVAPVRPKPANDFEDLLG